MRVVYVYEYLLCVQALVVLRQPLRRPANPRGHNKRRIQKLQIQHIADSRVRVRKRVQEHSHKQEDEVRELRQILTDETDRLLEDDRVEQVIQLILLEYLQDLKNPAAEHGLVEILAAEVELDLFVSEPDVVPVLLVQHC